MVVALLTILGTLLNATGLELALTRDLDLEKDLRATGIANIAGALGGGMPGYQMIPHTLLGQRMGLRSVLPGLSAAAGCLLIFIYGATLLSALPAGLFVAVIAYLGLDLLITWLWVRRRQFSLTDYALVLLILAVAATIGFFEALGIGILAAAAMFIVSFARVNVVRLRSTLASRRSLVERGERRGQLPHADRPPGRGDRTQRLPVLRHRQLRWWSASMPNCRARMSCASW